MLTLTLMFAHRHHMANLPVAFALSGGDRGVDCNGAPILGYEWLRNREREGERQIAEAVKWMKSKIEWR